MGSPPGKGPNLEPVAAAAVWGAATRAGLRPRGSCPVLGDCARGQLGGEGSAMCGEVSAATDRPLPVPSRRPRAIPALQARK